MNAPKQFYISPLWLPLFKDSDVNNTRVKQNRIDDTDIKYLSEDHVKELLAEKDKEIKSLKENEDLLRNRKNEHIELLKSEIESKDKEIPNWIPVTTKPEFDGEYLCLVMETEQCGVTYTKQRVLCNSFNTWMTLANQSVLFWMPLPKQP